MTAPHILLLTGVPGIGKTTVIRSVAERLAGHSVAGFYTEEMREQGMRTGFRLLGFHGEQGVIAHIDFDHRQRVGKYGVDVDAIDRLAEATLPAEPRIELYLVDEIGKMECLSPHFVSAMRSLLATGRPLIATIALRGSGFIDEVKARRDAECWMITHANREQMPERVLAWLKERGIG